MPFCAAILRARRARACRMRDEALRRRPLAADGYDVLAVDLDPPMIPYAQAHYPGADFRVLDMRDVGSLEKGL